MRARAGEHVCVGASVGVTLRDPRVARRLLRSRVWACVDIRLLMRVDVGVDASGSVWVRVCVTATSLAAVVFPMPGGPAMKHARTEGGLLGLKPRRNVARRFNCATFNKMEGVCFRCCFC